MVILQIKEAMAEEKKGRAAAVLNQGATTPKEVTTSAAPHRALVEMVMRKRWFPIFKGNIDLLTGGK